MTPIIPIAMKKIYTLTVTLLLLFLFLPLHKTTAQEGNYASDRIIVKFDRTIEPVISRNSDRIILFGVREADALNIRFGCVEAKRLLQGRRNTTNSDIFLLTFRGNPDIRELIRAYQATGSFQYAEPDYIGTSSGSKSLLNFPTDLYFYRQWSLYNDGTFPFLPAKTGADIDMLPAWDIEQGDTDIIAGILDTGCKIDHPDFSERIWTNAGEIPANGVDDDGNGYVDDVYGWNMAYGNNVVVDDQGHGTCVAGVLGAAGDNGFGYAGIDWHCKLMNLKVQNSSAYGYYSWWIEGIEYAVDNGARVLNMSLGGTGFSQTLLDAVNYALTNNVAVVAAMGNTNTIVPLYPAAFPGVIAAGSTDPDDSRSHPFFTGELGSNFGSHLSVVAPGNYIFGLDYLHDYEFFYAWAGTSFATPHIAGVASLLLSQNPARTPAEIKSILENSAEDMVGNPYEDAPGWDPYYGHGRLNAYNALSGKEAMKVTQLTSNLKVYPNPAYGKIIIEIPDAFGQYNLSVFSPGGSELYAQSINVQKTLIDLGHLPCGLYFVKVTGERMVMVEKVVKH